MNIHEYQGKQLLKLYDVTVPEGQVIFSIEDGLSIWDRFKNSPLVLKAQIHSGGRGSAGGILFSDNYEHFEESLKSLFGNKLITKQSGGQYKTVKSVLVERVCGSTRDFYFGIVLDRNVRKVCIMLSDRGGVDVEDNTNKKHLKKMLVDFEKGLVEENVKNLLAGFELNDSLCNKFQKIIRNLYDAFFDLDATLIEINPIIIGQDDTLIALDSKWNFDPNGLKRQPDILALRDKSEEDRLEIESAKYNLSFIRLNGNIGCMVNGAGLAMATMDVIKLMGGEPANFLDVGGGASVEKVSKAYEILVSNPSVRIVLINIFGGIMRCDYVAQGLVNALQNSSKKMKIVARIKGFKESEAKEIIKEARLPILFVDDLEQAVQTVIREIKEY
jgi:succinyl-CoA synthetase beta subunit